MLRCGRFARWALGLVMVASAVVSMGAMSSQAAVVPPNFTEQIVFAGLQQPTNIEFAKDGRVFVAERRGVIKVFPSVTSSSYTIFADLSAQVAGFWDRGLLGMALAPNFPDDPYVYVLYTYDAPPGQNAPYWHDSCSLDVCPVTGRLSRLTAAGNVMTGPETVLISNDWCQQFSSHSIGDLHFDGSGALLASGGDGASFNTLDYGQLSSKPNFCNDPPGGTALAPPTAEGGALRSQDVRTTADPTGLDGTVLRINPATGLAMADNPITGLDANARRIIGYGLRNPMRFAVRPGTNEVWVGDVGWRDTEEINRLVRGAVNSAVPNFGWPCYEGPIVQSLTKSANLNLCESLYTSAAAKAPYYSWQHSTTGPGGCPRSGSAAVTGLTFYPDGLNTSELLSYPTTYRGALFFGDYARGCIWAMRAPTPGALPSTSLVEAFDTGAATPVDLALGPRGEIYYVDFSGGTVRRYRYNGTGNQPPVAVATVSVPEGSLTATFDGSGSSDPDSYDQGLLKYAWDFGDGTEQAASTQPTATHTYAAAGVYTASLTVTDTRNDYDVRSFSVAPGKAAPVPVIDTPTAGTQWQVGQSLSFTGHATDADASGGPAMPASALRWSLRMQHCSTLGDCHLHYLREWTGVSSGTFVAPDHEYPSYMELELTALDADGLQTSVVRRLDPMTVSVKVVSDPAGAVVSAGDFTGVTPFTRTFIKGSSATMSTIATQLVGDTVYQWRSWSDGGARTHVVTTSANSTYTASFTATTTVNLALNESTKADSSCSTDQGPAKAVNGTTNGGIADRWCSAGSNKWMQVDLGAEREIFGFLVHHAGAGGEDPAFNTRDFTIQVSKDGTTWKTAVTVTGNADNTTIHPTTTTGRYVRLAIAKANGNATPQAHIYELEVLGVKPKLPIGSSLPNLAAGKVATADSRCAPDNGPDKAVNGRWVGAWNGWCSAGASKWLRVDLGASRAIGTIVIRHAGASGESDLLNTRDFTLQVSADATTWTTIATITGNVQSVSTHTVNATGRYVRLLITTPTSGGDAIARIYEIEVYPPPSA